MLPLTLKFAAALVTAAVLQSCDSGSPIDGSYDLPTAAIGVVTESRTEEVEFRGALDRFAQRHGLHQTPGNKYMTDVVLTEYSPSDGNHRDGFSMALVEPSATCFIVRFTENSGIWTDYSLASFKELVTKLEEGTTARVRVLIRPKNSQNYPEVQAHGYTDTEQYATNDEACRRTLS